MGYPRVHLQKDVENQWFPWKMIHKWLVFHIHGSLEEGKLLAIFMQRHSWNSGMMGIGFEETSRIGIDGSMIGAIFR
jgi:hypothetical protein